VRQWTWRHAPPFDGNAGVRPALLLTLAFVLANNILYIWQPVSRYPLSIDTPVGREARNDRDENGNADTHRDLGL
jgi:hypothetical protein